MAATMIMVVLMQILIEELDEYNLDTEDHNFYADADGGDDGDDDDDIGDDDVGDDDVDDYDDDDDDDDGTW